MPGSFNYGGSATEVKETTSTSTTGGANSPSLAGDGSLALGSAPAISKKGKLDQSISTKVGNTTNQYKVGKGGSLVINPPSVTVPTVPAVTVPGASAGGGASVDSSGVLASIANLISTARSSVTGDTAPVSVASVVKYGLIIAFPIVALVIWVIVKHYKKNKA